MWADLYFLSGFTLFWCLIALMTALITSNESIRRAVLFYVSAGLFIICVSLAILGTARKIRLASLQGQPQKIAIENSPPVIGQPAGSVMIATDATTPDAWVSDGIYEIDGYLFDGTNYDWVFKNNLRQFVKNHPDLQINCVQPSVYFVNDWRGIPQKYFIFVSKKPVSGEVTTMPLELK